MTIARPSPHRRRFERRWLARFAAAGVPFVPLLTVGRFLRIARNEPWMTLPVLAGLRERERDALHTHLAMVTDETEPAQSTAVFLSGDLAESLSAAPGSVPPACAGGPGAFIAGFSGSGGTPF